MAEVIRKIDRRAMTAEPDALLTREWLVPNGLGGYASGTLAGIVTRRYHGLLVAALPAPLGRLVMLNHMAELIILPDGRTIELSGEELEPGRPFAPGLDHLVEFRTEMGLPVWRYDIGGTVIERQIVMPHGQNIVHVTYRQTGGTQPAGIQLRPLLGFRPLEAPVNDPGLRGYRVIAEGERFSFTPGPEQPTLRMIVTGAPMTFTIDGGGRREIAYRLEAERGYESRGPLWAPGYFAGRIDPGQSLTVIAGAEPWQTMEALRPDDVLVYETGRRRRLINQAHPALRQGAMAELVLAADAFIFTPSGRVADMVRARAEGDEIRSVIAGYHWFTDWGRDTMISLEGLTLATGRPAEAGWILRTFAHYVRDGLIPNMFPEGSNEGLYHTADATLWFFHALHRYLCATGDRTTLRLVLPKLKEIIERHQYGTRFGIGVDPRDGLLRQGAEGYQLTWMDAKVEGWVVTPRRGKAVEINALWYNALCLMAAWLGEEEGEPAAAPVEAMAGRVRDAFNQRFWFDGGHHLHDVIDGEGGDEAACRPNQILAIALDHPVLDRARWQTVLDTVCQRLLTPVGLRSLAPGHPDYKPKYFGDLRARDAAYHQGTVWGWLIGPLVDAWIKVRPDDRAGARRLLEGFLPHLDQACIGSISEIFDAEAPFTPRGCVAQAWSVAEVLRCWMLTEPAAGGDKAKQ